MKGYFDKIGSASYKASQKNIRTEIKNKVLYNYVKLLNKNKFKILKENKKDIKFAIKKKLHKSLISRLEINETKFPSIIKTIQDIINFKDPVGSIIEKWKRPNRLNIKKITIPIGVIGVIYESRPNVTVDLSCLCFKSGNSVILKGGSEAFQTNKILVKLFRKSLKAANVDQNFVQFINKKNRKVVDYLLTKMDSYLDVIIPRGGKSLVKKVKKICNIPMIGHLEGVCHTYLDKKFNLDIANKIILNAKLRNVSICGATETLLVHKDCPKKKIIYILENLIAENCKIFADNKINKFFKGKIFKATEKNWGREYLDSIISVKIVNNVKDAVAHINKYGTMHTDAIITTDILNADYFLKSVKSSIAIHNSSTQFADGAELGFGGEVGISTNKLPPRGPVGLNQLVSYKYLVAGNGQIR